MELECYPTSNRLPEIVPGRQSRAWMDHFMERHPYRCLPLSMANTSVAWLWIGPPRTLASRLCAASRNVMAWPAAGPSTTTRS